MRTCAMETRGKLPSGRTMTHLAYRPLLPSGNKYLQQKWDKASYDLHRGKVKSAKPTINTNPPKTYGHLALKTKKRKLEEELLIKIQRENNILMEKISRIMTTAGAVDNWNYYDKKSLGKEKRQLELMRITKENQMILIRLSQCRTRYDVKNWHKEWLKTLKVMDNIACYPRGRVHQQKGQEKFTKKCRDYNKEQKTGADATTYSPVTNKANEKEHLKKMRKRKDTNKKEGIGIEVQQTS